MGMNGNGVYHDEAPESYELMQITKLEQLIEHWPLFRKGIDRIKARDKMAGSWTHNQIFNAIRFGLPTAPQRTTAVEAFVAVNASGTPVAFMVTTPKVDPFRNNVPVGIVVWLLYANFELIKMFLPHLEMLCKRNGGDIIEFQSGRQGWLHYFSRMARLGFRLAEYKIVKDVVW